MRAMTSIGYPAVSFSVGGRVSPTHAKSRRDNLPPSLPIDLAAPPPDVVVGESGTARGPLESAQPKLKQAATAPISVDDRFIEDESPRETPSGIETPGLLPQDLC